MKHCLLFLLLSCCVKAHAQFAVYDPVNHVTRLQELALQYLEYAKQINEVSHTYEQLNSIKGIVDLVNFIAGPELAELRKHAPDKFVEILDAVVEIEGGAAAVERLLEDLDGFDSDSYWSRRHALNRMYSTQVDLLARTRGFAAADYDVADESMKLIADSINHTATYEDQKQRDQASLKLQGEQAVTQYKILQSMAVMQDTLANEQRNDLILQKEHVQSVENLSALIPVE